MVQIKASILFLTFSLFQACTAKGGCVHPPVPSDPWATLPPTPSLEALYDEGYVTVDDGTAIWYGLSGVPKHKAGAKWGRPSCSKTPLLFLHGGFANSDYWANQINCLAADHTIVSIDSRGHGRSYDGPAPITYDRMTTDVITVLDHLGIQKVDLIGWSDGAIIGFDIAMNHSQYLNSLFAFGGSYSPDNANHTAEESPVVQEFFGRVATEYAALSPTPDHFGEFADKMNTMFATLPVWDATSFAEIPTRRRRGHTSPTIWVVDGAEEEIVNRDVPSTLASWIPRSKLVIIPDVSHFGLLQLPAQFTDTIRSFLG